MAEETRERGTQPLHRWLWNKLTARRGLSLGVLLFAVLSLLQLSGLVYMPFWPFTTLGRVYVDSPEVYTRERLVNDRYDQDYWLRTQLERLAEVTPDDLISGRFFATTSGSLAGGDAAPADPAEEAPERPAEIETLSVRDRFLVLSGLRDMIRQQILENMLDDRHDLTANSVYGLKFDTAVIPGSNTRNAAFVEVKIQPDDLFLPVDERNPVGCIAPKWWSRFEFWREPDAIASLDEGYLQCFVCEEAKRRSIELPQCRDGESPFVAYKKQEDLYEAWLLSIMKRLIAAEEALYKSVAGDACGPNPQGVRREDYPELIVRALEVVLNVPAMRFRLDNAELFRAAVDADARVETADGADEKAENTKQQPDLASCAAWLGFQGTTPIGAETVPALLYCSLVLSGLAESAQSPETASEVGSCVAGAFQEGRGNTVKLREPYSKYFRVTARPIFLPADDHDIAGCNMRVDFNVAPITEGVIALRRDALADWAADESAGDAAKDVRHDIANVARDKELTQCSEQAANAATQIEFDVTRDESWAFFIPEAALSQLGCYYVGEEWSLRYKPPSDLLNTLRELEIPRVYGDDAPWGVVYDAAAARGSAFGVEAEPREVSLCGGFYLQFPAGLFNFIESMRELDAYAYAVFPKNDVLGVVVDTQVGAQGMASGGRVDVVRRQSRSSTEPVLTSYGTGRRLEDSDAPRAVRFGWIISAGDRLLPSLKTQLALVSVPAWTDKLEVTVTTGWLDRWGRQHNAQTMAPMEIKLPPDFSAFDSIFRSHGWVTPAPQIQDEAIDDDIYVIVGEDARILIPGFRLWRSTSVTLGAQPADRIRVLPNMEGIIAEFLPVRLPSAKYKARSEVSAEQQDWSSSAQSDASSAPPAGETETTQDRAGQDTAPSGQEVAEACDLGDVPDQTLRNVLQKTMQARSVRLRVWTSEGVALATKRVCVMYDPKRQLVQRLAEREDLRHERERRAVLGSDAAAKEAKEKEGEER